MTPELWLLTQGALVGIGLALALSAARELFR